jgi:hypothetical protein
MERNLLSLLINKLIIQNMPKDIVLVFLFLISFLSSFAQPNQEKVVASPPSAIAPTVMEEIPKISDEDLNQKLNAIDELNLSYQEKENIKNEFLSKYALNEEQKSKFIPFSDITFQPKYFPSKILNKWLSIVLTKNPKAMFNIVVVNEAYSIDYNNYGDKELDFVLNKLIEDNPLSEELAKQYILPNFDLILKNNVNIKPYTLLNMVQLFYANQPGLYYLLPSDLAWKIKDKDSIVELYQDN